MENMIWALIVVTGAGSVSFSSNYPNKAICEDAISMARTGMTVEERKASDARSKQARQEGIRKYQEAHPTRPTKAEDEKNCFDGRTGSGFGFGSSGSYCIMERDGQTRFYPMNVATFNTTYNATSEVKYAKCVMVPKDEK